MNNKVLFLTLKVFSAMGGIEKVCRVAGKALHEICAEEEVPFELWSLYDRTGDCDERYLPASAFRGFEGSKGSFVATAVKEGRGAGVVILSHINLLTIGYAIKKLSPLTKLVLVAHGIEVWEPVPLWKRKALDACDLILPVSRFTRNKMLQVHGLAEEKVVVVNNCLDPFLPLPTVAGKRADLLSRYGLTGNDKILFTLTRLSSAERYKGYDEVIMALKKLRKEDISFKYLIVGKWDAAEKARLDRLIEQQGLNGNVIFTGFVADEELADHFKLADIYIMPSRGEGFGIVFIEAAFYGKPVIAGNRDGSVDALAGGKFGRLVNPNDCKQIAAAIMESERVEKKGNPQIMQVMERFGFSTYKNKLNQLLFSSSTTGDLSPRAHGVTVKPKQSVNLIK